MVRPRKPNDVTFDAGVARIQIVRNNGDRFEALLDKADYYFASPFRWSLCAGGASGLWYAWTSYDSDQRLRMHTLVMGEAPPLHVVDHINGNGLDNRRSNLRVIHRALHTANMRGKCDALISYKGVSRNGNSGFQAEIRVFKERRYLGTFPTPEEAARAYDEAALAAFGECARINFPLGAS